MTKHARLALACILLPAVALIAAQPGTPAPQPPRQAVCDVYRIADRLLNTERFRKAAEAHLTELAKPVNEQNAALNALGKELDNVPNDQRNTPEWHRRVASYTEMKQAADKARFNFQAESAKYLTARNADGYKEILAAAKSVADRRGYTWVINSRAMTRPEEKPSESPDAFLREVMSRPVVVWPGQDDITDDVIKSLGLDQPPAALPTTAPAGAPAATPAPSSERPPAEPSRP